MAYVEAYLNSSNNPNSSCYANFKLGFGNWMLDRKDLVPQYLERSKLSAKEHFEHDYFAKLMIEKYEENNNTFTKFDESRIMTENYLQAREFNAASQCLTHIQEYIQEGDYKNQESEEIISLWESYFRGLLCNGEKKYEEAIQILENEVLPHENKIKNVRSSFYMIPYSLVEIGEALMKLDRKDEAIQYFRRAKGYSNYLFEKYLMYRIIRPLESIKDISKPLDDH